MLWTLHNHLKRRRLRWLAATVKPPYRTNNGIAIQTDLTYSRDMENSTLHIHQSESDSAQGASLQTTPKVRKFSTESALEKTKVLVEWLTENKARDIVALHIASQSQCTDAVIVVTASSLRHAKSLADGLMDQCSKRNYEFLRMEGYQNGLWILADLNDIVVHIFQKDTRDLYRIDALWKQAPVLHGDTARPDLHPEEAPE